jgi:hypothetical protein
MDAMCFQKEGQLGQTCYRAAIARQDANGGAFPRDSERFDCQVTRLEIGA